MDSPGIEFDEEQHVESSQPDRLDGEEVAGHDPGRRLAQERPPRRGRAPRRRIEPVTAQRGADRGGRDPNTQP
jgi:hypothetical protein